MRRLADLALLALQWTLMALGLLTVPFSVQGYMTEVELYASLPKADRPAGSYYIRPSPFRSAVIGVTAGLLAMGLGAALFHLRRLCPARRTA